MSPKTIEWERVALDGGALDLYIARLIEPHPTGPFATLYRQRGQWRLVWYPNVNSNGVKSFEVSTREKGAERVERWAKHHGAKLPHQPHPGRSDFYAYDTRRL